MSTQGSLFAVTTVYGLGDTSCYSCPFVAGIDTNAGHYSWRLKSKTAALVEIYPVTSPTWIDNGKTSTYISYYPVVETGVPTDLTGYGDSYPPYTIDIDRIGTHVLGKPTTAKYTRISNGEIDKDAAAFTYIVYLNNAFFTLDSGEEVLWMIPVCDSMYSAPIENYAYGQNGTQQFSAWKIQEYQWEDYIYIYNASGTDENGTFSSYGTPLWCGGYTRRSDDLSHHGMYHTEQFIVD